MYIVQPMSITYADINNIECKTIMHLKHTTV